MSAVVAGISVPEQSTPGLVSVIIPVYNQASFLGEAVSSVLAQTYSHREIIVVDDGSTDDPAGALEGIDTVRLIVQRNQGVTRARAEGLRVCRGEFVVFLDADDRICPAALETGVAWLRRHPEAAFVSGQYILVDSDGAVLHRPERPPVSREHYLALLRGNYVGMLATVMFRRERFRGLDRAVAPVNYCQDYALMLAIARRNPVGTHSTLVAEYRIHQDNRSAHAAGMLQSVMRMLDWERRYLHDQTAIDALEAGRAYYASYYGNQLVTQLRKWERKGHWRRVVPALLVLWHHHPQGFRHHVRTKLQGLWRRVARPPRVVRRRKAGQKSLGAGHGR